MQFAGASFGSIAAKDVTMRIAVFLFGLVAASLAGHRQPPRRTMIRRAQPRYAKMHPCERKAQRPRRSRPRHVPPHVFRDARQLVVRRLLQKRSYHVGMGIADRCVEASQRAVVGDSFYDRRRSVRIVERTLPTSIRRTFSGSARRRIISGKWRDRSVRSLFRNSYGPDCRRQCDSRARECRLPPV